MLHTSICVCNLVTEAIDERQKYQMSKNKHWTIHTASMPLQSTSEMVSLVELEYSYRSFTHHMDAFNCTEANSVFLELTYCIVLISTPRQFSDKPPHTNPSINIETETCCPS